MIRPTNASHAALVKALSSALFIFFSAALYSSRANASDCFDDQQLAQLGKSNNNSAQGTLVYVWSPRMVLSVLQAGEAAQAAHAAGLLFLALHDAKLAPAEWQEALQASADAQATQWLKNSQPLCSNSLQDAQALRHFPTAFVHTERGIHRFPIVGAMPPAAWQSSISSRLQP